MHFIPATRLLYTAVCDGVDYTALSTIEQVLNCQTIPCLVSDRVMRTLLESLRKAESVMHVFDRVSSTTEMARIVASYVAMLSSEDVRILRCGSYMWVRLEADRTCRPAVFADRRPPCSAGRPACLAG